MEMLLPICVEVNHNYNKSVNQKQHTMCDTNTHY